MINGYDQKKEQSANEEKFWLLLNAFNRDYFSLLWRVKENSNVAPAIIEQIIDQIAKVLDSGWGDISISIAEKKIIMIYGRQTIKVKQFNPGEPEEKEGSNESVNKVKGGFIE